MDINRLQEVINALATVTEITDEQKSQLVTKYSSMNDTEVIKDLAEKAYTLLKDNNDAYEYSLEVIRLINPELCPPIETMKAILDNMFNNNIEGNMSLEENHALVVESLKKYTKLFNEAGIDYYIVGALPCFLKAGIPLFRYHDDIDIMVNEDDLKKIADIIEETGYQFHDDRFPDINRLHEMMENKPPHTVLAQNPDNEFHLGFFTFKREQDNSITMREYSHREVDGEVVVDLLERKTTPEATDLKYDSTPTQFEGTEFKTSSIESVYNLKQYTKRPKDVTDVQKLAPYVDQNKLSSLQNQHSENVVTEGYSPESNGVKL